MDPDQAIRDLNTPYPGLIEHTKRQAERAEKAVLREEFTKVNLRDLAAMTDEGLAAWQSGYPIDSPQFLLASQEWIRRVTTSQIKATRFSAWMTLFAAVTGATVGVLLTVFVTAQLSPQPKPPGDVAAYQTNGRGDQTWQDHAQPNHMKKTAVDLDQPIELRLAP